jgi:hypothetical protein
MADDDDVTEAETEPSDDDRIDRVEHKVDALTALMEKIIPKAHQASTAKVEARLDRPTTVEEQVQAELARAENERKEQERRDDIDSRLAALEAPPPEQPPAPPVPWRQRILGWG